MFTSFSCWVSYQNHYRDKHCIVLKELDNQFRVFKKLRKKKRLIVKCIKCSIGGVYMEGGGS